MVVGTYAEIIRSYVEKGYAQKLTPEEAAQITPKTWYLPHFPVTNPNKPGKVRMVFDAAAKVNGTSLNSCLLKGPQEYKPLPDVLFNFRLGAIAVCADIQEMFHQEMIRPEDRVAQRFLWRDGVATKPPDIYEMKVMTFGAACSPCLAQYVKTLNALQHTQCNNRAIKAILEDHYVDDFVDSFESDEQAIDISRQVTAIHKNAGFILRGLISNSTAVMSALEASEKRQLQLSKNEEGLATEKVLGMYWEPGNDVFRYKLKFHKIYCDIIDGNRLPTKRELLSMVMSVFDPLGFLSHLLIAAKLLMREIWRSNIGWDEAITECLGRAWQIWLNNLKCVKMLSIPRRYFPNSVPKQVELHVFVDASEDACAVVAYWRSVAEQTEVAFIYAKTKCAPLKTMSIPRLELQAAVMGSRLKTTVLDSNSFDVVRCVLWSDSKTVIKWIKSPNRRFKPFVSHRITEILNNTTANEWRWLPTEENVADEATRMQRKINLTFTCRWFTGPKILFDDDCQWPAAECNDEVQDSEVLGPKFVLTLSTDTLIEWYTCEVHGLTATELEKAEYGVLKRVQNEVYREQLAVLSNGKALQKGYCLSPLLPYLDEHKVLRVGGRLNAATWMPTETMHPIILPLEHALTLLIIERYHHKGHHQNNELVICEIRRRYWVPRLRQVVRKVVSRCLTVRAIHLEIAKDLSTDACILVMRNFMGRRGIPQRIRTDNGKNFVVLANDLRSFRDTFDCNQIQAELSNRGVEWIFNCPRNPSEGGIWQRMVQSVKRGLRYTLRESSPQEHTLNTLLIEAENIINSRPLTHVHVAANDEEPLTPNHFLLGYNNAARIKFKEEDLRAPDTLRKQWRIVKQLKTQFWKRWVLEYLPTLTRRAKWCQRTEPLKTNDLVFICDENLPREQWCRGKVVQVYAGKDGEVRRADVMTKAGVIRRAASRLAVLDVR